MRKEPIAVSLALHIAVVGSLLLLRIPQQYADPVLLPRPLTFKITRLTAPAIRRSASAPAPAGRSGGGARSPLPPSKGAPSRAETRIFIPPQIDRPERPQLVVPMGVEDAPKIAMAALGDPLGRTGVPSLGPGVDGIGGPGKHGYGPDPGGRNGPGGTGPGGSVYSVKPSKWPELLFKSEPEYSDHARKAHHQGTVLLAVDVGTDGRPRNIRIIRSLGLGLDEKAMDAVATWRFKPALANGRPVPAPITVEVNFRLL